MVDERLHRALHLPPGRRRDLAGVDHDRTLLRHLLQALPDDPVGLAHLLHADEIPRVAVAGEADRYVEVHAVIAVVRLRPAQVPGHDGSAQHRPGEAPGERLLLGDDADIPGTLLADPFVA